MALDDAARVIHFWFGSPPTHQPRPEWFRKDPAFDERIRAAFGPWVDQALAGGHRAWDATPSSALARILLLDQFPRNLFRGSAKAFAGDPLALAAARAMVARGDHRWLTPRMRSFVYLPFEHAEDAAAQAESLRHFARLGAEHPELADLEEWAKKHEAIIARFGRYPHRNQALGRESTPEEIAFLREPGSSF